MDLNKKCYLLLILVYMGCSGENEQQIERRYYFNHPSMGSMFQVIVYARDSLEVSRVVNLAFTQLDSLNFTMSDYLPHSELMQLSRTSGSGEYVKVSPELYKVLELSHYWYDWSGGIFDVTVGPYSQLWRRAKRQDRIPSEEEIEQASSSVGFNLVEIDSSNRVKLLAENMQLDLGGIAKGYAVDMIYDLLVQQGFNKCLVDGGGDLRLGEAPPQKKGWEVAVKTYLGNDSTLVDSNVAIATSGDFYRSLEIDGKRYSHIIDPFTGYGISNSRAVTAMAEDCTTADVLASVFSVTGPDNTLLNDNLPYGSRILIYEKVEDQVLVYAISSKKNRQIKTCRFYLAD